MLLEYKIPTILVMPNAVAKRWDKDVMNALEENRLLIFSIWENRTDDEIVPSSNDRNEIILLLADKTIVGYCREGGKLEKQIKGKENIEILSAMNTSEKNLIETFLILVCPVIVAIFILTSKRMKRKTI